MNTCFSIMPFDKGFEDIEDIIRSVALECGLEYVRGDRRNQPGSIMPQILHDIRRAAVVVADITGNNPNVFYELGIAHHIKGPDHVVIIKQKRMIRKSMTCMNSVNCSMRTVNRAVLTSAANCPNSSVRAAIATHTEQEIWNVIRGRLQRTRLIVRDLQRLVDTAGLGGLKNVTIRIAAGLGSLAISDHEPSESTVGSRVCP